MTNLIPILFNHASDKPIGCFKDGVITLLKENAMTQSQVESTFGNIGYFILEKHLCPVTHVEMITKIKIMEWSL